MQNDRERERQELLEQLRAMSVDGKAPSTVDKLEDLFLGEGSTNTKGRVTKWTSTSTRG